MSGKHQLQLFWLNYPNSQTLGEDNQKRVEQLKYYSWKINSQIKKVFGLAVLEGLQATEHSLARSHY